MEQCSSLKEKKCTTGRKKALTFEPGSIVRVRKCGIFYIYQYQKLQES